MGWEAPGPPADTPVTLSRHERRKLEELTRKATAPHRDVMRARIILLAADGWTNAAIACHLDCALNTVRAWRRRFAALHMEGLKDRPRSGRPPRYDGTTHAIVKAIACELPSERGLPLSRLSMNDIHKEVSRELRPCPSVSTIARWLREDAIRPWSHRSWISPRDPDFLAKASPVLDLYHRRYKGRPLGPQDVIISADEKPIQMVRRIVPLTPPSPGQPMRVEHEYERLGVSVYLGAFNVRTGKVVGRCVPRNTKDAFKSFVDNIMSRKACRSASNVFLIVDNGSAHKPESFAQWLASAHPKVILVPLPTHASWLNQVEIYFSIVQRKALTPMDLPDADALPVRLSAFERRYNKDAYPFSWKFTRGDLKDLVGRLGTGKA